VEEEEEKKEILLIIIIIVMMIIIPMLLIALRLISMTQETEVEGEVEDTRVMLLLPISYPSMRSCNIVRTTLPYPH
jgi:flagellar basal body-associated protein FliL